MEKGYHPCHASKYKIKVLKERATSYSHLFVRGVVLDEENPWKDLLQQSFSWAYSPEGSAYWETLWMGRRPVTDKDVSILFAFYEVNVKEVTIEDII